MSQPDGFDDYINITQEVKEYCSKTGLLKYPGKWVYDIRLSSQLMELASKTGYPPDWLIRTKEGKNGGTHIHPVLYPLFRKWLTGTTASKKPSIVYAVSAIGTGRTKVGVTSDIKKRLAYIQSCCPVKLKVLRVVKTPIALKLEGLLHSKLDEFRKHGEWFEIEEADLLKIFDHLT